MKRRQKRIFACIQRGFWEMIVKQIRVFVASSTEGQMVASRLRIALQEELGRDGRVEIWFHKFAVGQTAIESLDAVANEADFAIVVMTGDDKTTSRDVTKSAPRDNLVFELGLFLGALGRDRSFAVRDRRADLKVPTDYVGVNTVMLDVESGDELEASLRQECVRLANQIRNIGSRSLWLRVGRAALVRHEIFANQIEGMWWQRVNHSTGTALSVLTITGNPALADVAFDGRGYGQDGSLSARWASTMVHLSSAERSLKYVWRGVHPLQGQVNLRYHGFGEIDFNAFDEEASRLTHGIGMFWDVDEARPSDTVAKPFELRRIADEKHQHVMTIGSSAECRSLVAATLADWTM